jgi:hypothetical protein
VIDTRVGGPRYLETSMGDQDINCDISALDLFLISDENGAWKQDQ